MSKPARPLATRATKITVGAACGITLVALLSPPELLHSAREALSPTVRSAEQAADPAFRPTYITRFPTMNARDLDSHGATHMTGALTQPQVAHLSVDDDASHQSEATARVELAHDLTAPDNDTETEAPNSAAPIEAEPSEATRTGEGPPVETNAAYARSTAAAEALMRMNYLWQQSVEMAAVNEYHLQTAIPMLQQARQEASELTEQLQALASESEDLRARLAESEALRRSLEVHAQTATVPQPPPVIQTTPPPLPAPTTVNPAVAVTETAPPTESAEAEPVHDPMPDLLVAISHTLSSTAAHELRSTPGLSVNEDMPNQLSLTSEYMTATHALDSYSSDVLNSTITINAPETSEAAAQIHDYLSSTFGPPEETNDSRTVFYGQGQDIELDIVNGSSATITITHTGLGRGPIHVFDAPPEERELPPLVTRYD